jgi:hypothetical protein
VTGLIAGSGRSVLADSVHAERQQNTSNNGISGLGISIRRGVCAVRANLITRMDALPQDVVRNYAGAKKLNIDIVQW